MTRREFDKPTRRAALARSGNRCEAEGALYGLDAGVRCNANLGDGMHFDHVLPDGLDGEPTLENCGAVCTRCHDWKTRHRDRPAIDKAKRVEEKRLGLRKPKSRPMQGSRASGWKRPMNGPAHRRGA